MSATSASTLFKLAGTIVIDTQTALDDVDKVIAKVDDLYAKLQKTSWGGFIDEIQGVDREVLSAGQSLYGLNTEVEYMAGRIGDLSEAYYSLGDEVSSASDKIGGNGGGTFKNIMINIASELIYDVMAAVGQLAVEFAGLGLEAHLTSESIVKDFENISGLDTSKAEALVKKLYDFAINTPYDVKAASAAAMSLLDAGFGDDEIVDQLYVLGELADNDATKLKKIAEIYADIVSFGKVRESDMEAFAEQGIFLEEMLGGYLGDSTILAKSVIDTFKYATSEGGQYYGKMAEYMETWASRTEQLGEQTEELAGIVTKPFIEQLRDFVMPVLKIQLEDFGDFYDDLNWGMEGAAEIIGSLIIIVVECLLQIAKLVTAALAIIGSIWNALKWLVDLIASSFGARKDILSPEKVREIISASSDLDKVLEYMSNNPETTEDKAAALQESQGTKTSPWAEQEQEAVVMPYMGVGIDYEEMLKDMNLYNPTPGATIGPKAPAREYMTVPFDKKSSIDLSLTRAMDLTRLEGAMSRIEAVLSEINSKTGQNQTVVLNTGQLVGAIAPQMDARLGLIGSLKARGNV